MEQDGVQKCLEQKSPLAALEERRLCQRPPCSTWQVEGSVQWLPSSLRERGTELLLLVISQLVRAALKGDAAVWCEDDFSNIVHDEATTGKGHFHELSCEGARQGGKVPWGGERMSMGGVFLLGHGGACHRVRQRSH
jgi:hypothetical protein